MPKQLLPVILSGGVGSRLWPISRAESPKQFIRLPDGESLIQKAFYRSALLPNVTDSLTLCNLNFLFRIESEYQALKRKHHLTLNNHFILEPFGRNTAPAIALAIIWAMKHYDDPTLLVLPSDHLIKDQNTFAKAIDEAIQLAQQKKIVTFGIQPTRPETGYGYIEYQGQQVTRFVEKPDKAKAAAFLESGHYLWNAGMLCFQASIMLKAMQHYCPDILTSCDNSLKNGHVSHQHATEKIKLMAKDFNQVREASIDYTIMEKTTQAAVVKSDILWDDIGNWQSFGKLMTQDEHGNSIEGHIMARDTYECIIRARGNRLVSTLGLKNLVIVDTDDAVLIADKRYTQEVRQIYTELKKQNDPRHASFPTVKRPWGSYTILDENVGYKVKRIEVQPGGQLSLQSHEHRSEHWTVIQGIATVTNHDKISTLSVNETTYIPCQTKHRLENHGNDLLIVIELQIGHYLGEDDIVRYEDRN